MYLNKLNSVSYGYHGLFDDRLLRMLRSFDAGDATQRQRISGALIVTIQEIASIVGYDAVEQSLVTARGSMSASAIEDLCQRNRAMLGALGSGSHFSDEFQMVDRVFCAAL